MEKNTRTQLRVKKLQPQPKKINLNLKKLNKWQHQNLTIHPQEMMQ